MTKCSRLGVVPRGPGGNASEVMQKLLCYCYLGITLEDRYAYLIEGEGRIEVSNQRQSKTQGLHGAAITV
jgi:hypothetical protein